jgi:hypothetical protein
MLGVHKTDDPRKALARWTAFDQEVLMPIRTTWRPKWLQETQVAEQTGLIMPSREDPRVSYGDRNEDSRILCGSI